MDEGGGGKLHIAVLPWLAMGHLIPFLHLSKRLAQKGHRISFITTPQNAAAISNLLLHNPTTSSIHLISIPLPRNPDHDLPPNAESTMEIENPKHPFLKLAFDSLSDPIADFLRSARPDWVVHDFAASWISPIAAEIGVPCVFFSVFNASTMCFLGPPAELLGASRRREDFTVAPPWVPFPSSVVFRPREVRRLLGGKAKRVDARDSQRFGGSSSGSDFVVIRTCSELEAEWIHLLSELYGKPVIPLGPLFPATGDEADGGDDWGGGPIKGWLDEQRVDSVLYVALGTEAVLTREVLAELAIGLEKSGSPFIWVLRNPPGSTCSVSETLPEGFEERVKGRGIVFTGWVPQVKVLGHPAIRGFLTHCGWNSVIEGLGYGRVLVLLPMMNDQPLAARLLVAKGLGVEIERDESDDSLSCESVVESVRFAMVEEGGEELRERARAMKDAVGNEELNDRYVENFIKYLIQYRKSP